MSEERIDELKVIPSEQVGCGYGSVAGFGFGSGYSYGSCAGFGVGLGFADGSGLASGNDRGYGYGFGSDACDKTLQRGPRR